MNHFEAAVAAHRKREAILVQITVLQADVEALRRVEYIELKESFL